MPHDKSQYIACLDNVNATLSHVCGVSTSGLSQFGAIQLPLSKVCGCNLVSSTCSPLSVNAFKHNGKIYVFKLVLY